MKVRQFALLGSIAGIVSLALAPSAYSEGVPGDVQLPSGAEAATLQVEVASLRAMVANLVELQRCHGDAGVDRRYIVGGGIGGADWIGGVDWSGCDKRGVWLRPAGYYDSGNLFNADLRGTDFTGAWINGVAMNGANLEGANFTNANLQGSILTGANIVSFDQAQAYGRAQTVFSNTVCPDGSNSDDVGGTCADNRTPD